MKKLACILTALFFAFPFCFNLIGFKLNLSKSLPYTLLFSFPAKSLEKNEIVTFKHPQAKVTFAKISAGLPQDFVEIVDRCVYVNGIPVGEKGVITQLTYLSPRQIPDGYFFAIGLTQDSFDSRYEDFGLIPISSIEEKLWPIF